MTLQRFASDIAIASFALALLIDIGARYQTWLSPLRSGGEVDVVLMLLYGTVSAMAALLMMRPATAGGQRGGWGPHLLAGSSGIMLIVSLAILGLVGWSAFKA